MKTLTISLHDEDMEYVEKQMEKTGYRSASEFVRGLIREDKFEKGLETTIDPELEATLLAALDEGPATPFTEQDWIDIKERGMARAAARQQKKADAER